MFAYFGTYHAILRAMKSKKVLRNEKMNPLFAGGVAGIAYCTFTYPIDTVKSKI